MTLNLPICCKQAYEWLQISPAKDKRPALAPIPAMEHAILLIVTRPLLTKAKGREGIAHADGLYNCLADERNLLFSSGFRSCKDYHEWLHVNRPGYRWWKKHLYWLAFWPHFLPVQTKANRCLPSALKRWMAIPLRKRTWREKQPWSMYGQPGAATAWMSWMTWMHLPQSMKAIQAWFSLHYRMKIPEK